MRWICDGICEVDSWIPRDNGPLCLINQEVEAPVDTKQVGLIAPSHSNKKMGAPKNGEHDGLRTQVNDHVTNRIAHIASLCGIFESEKNK